MEHVLQEVYSRLVLEKLRKETVLKDGTVFNNDYDGDPTSGSVKVPTRDTEVAASDYDKAAGLAPSTGSTAYVPILIDKDKAVNEIIDGYDAQAVPDGIVAERLDSAGYSLALAMDTDGATALLGAGTVVGLAAQDKDTIYAALVAQRVAMDKANIPGNGRYALVTPDYIGLITTAPEFVHATILGDSVVQSGSIGRIAGFNVIEWNDTTANLAMICGHPRFGTRINAWKVPVGIQSLDGDAAYIGASAVKGRMVYAHKVLRSVAIRCVYAPSAITASAAVGATTGTTILTLTDAASCTSYKYVKNPSARQVYNATPAGTALVSGTTEIAVTAGDVIEIVGIKSSKVVAVGYYTVAAADIKTA